MVGGGAHDGVLAGVGLCHGLRGCLAVHRADEVGERIATVADIGVVVGNELLLVVDHETALISADDRGLWKVVRGLTQDF